MKRIVVFLAVIVLCLNVFSALAEEKNQIPEIEKWQFLKQWDWIVGNE